MPQSIELECLTYFLYTKLYSTIFAKLSQPSASVSADISFNFDFPNPTTHAHTLRESSDLAGNELKSVIKGLKRKLTKL